MSTLILRPFLKSDFSTYRSWFQDPALASALGPLDHEWLDHILNDDMGVELAACRNDHLIGVIGLTYGTHSHPCHVITNIAVKPDERNRGIGTEMIKLVISRLEASHGNCWLCYINVGNVSAQAFFRKIGWKQIKTEADGMLAFQIRPSRRLV